jgi:hypothetical protein
MNLFYSFLIVFFLGNNTIFSSSREFIRASSVPRSRSPFFYHNQGTGIKSDYNNLLRKLKEYESLNRYLEEKLKDLEAREDNSGRLQELLREEERRNSELKETILVSEKNLQEMIAVYNTLNTKNNELEEENNTLRRKFKESQEKYNLLSARYNYLEEDNQKLLQMYQEKQEQYQILENDLQEREEERANLQSQIDEIRNLVFEKDLLLKKLEEKLQLLKNEEQSQEQKRCQLVEQIKDHKERENSYLKESADKVQKINDLKERLEKEKNITDILKEKIVSLEKEKLSLEQALEDLQNEFCMMENIQDLQRSGLGIKTLSNSSSQEFVYDNGENDSFSPPTKGHNSEIRILKKSDYYSPRGNDARSLFNSGCSGPYKGVYKNNFGEELNLSHEGSQYKNSQTGEQNFHESTYEIHEKQNVEDTKSSVGSPQKVRVSDAECQAEFKQDLKDRGVQSDEKEKPAKKSVLFLKALVGVFAVYGFCKGIQSLKEGVSNLGQGYIDYFSQVLTFPFFSNYFL